MKVKHLRELVRGALKQRTTDENNTTGAVASFSPGQGEQHTGNRAFKKPLRIDHSAATGLTKHKGKKRPYSTKLFDYL